MKSLFEITQEALELASLLEEEEFTPELEERLKITRGELEEKAINYGKVIKTIEADVSTIDEEIKRLQALKSSKNKVIDRMKESVSNAMLLFNCAKIQTPLMTLSFRKSEVLEIEDENDIDIIFKDTKTVTTINKNKLKSMIKDGYMINGAKIITKQNLQIK